MIALESELKSNEKRILILLFPDNAFGLRTIVDKLVFLNTTTAKRALTALEGRR